MSARTHLANRFNCGGQAAPHSKKIPADLLLKIKIQAVRVMKESVVCEEVLVT